MVDYTVLSQYLSAWLFLHSSFYLPWSDESLFIHILFKISRNINSWLFIRIIKPQCCHLVWGLFWAQLIACLSFGLNELKAVPLLQALEDSQIQLLEDSQIQLLNTTIYFFSAWNWTNYQGMKLDSLWYCNCFLLFVICGGVFAMIGLSHLNN